MKETMEKDYLHNQLDELHKLIKEIEYKEKMLESIERELDFQILLSGCLKRVLEERVRKCQVRENQSQNRFSLRKKMSA